MVRVAHISLIRKKKDVRRPGLLRKRLNSWKHTELLGIDGRRSVTWLAIDQRTRSRTTSTPL